MPALSRSPLGARPRRRAMLVDAQVSSMNTRRSGSRSSWASNQSQRRVRMSGRFCSAACAVFFKRQAAAVEEGPKRRPSRIHITLRGKLVEYLADGHVRRGLDEPENVITVRIELGAAYESRSRAYIIATETVFLCHQDGLVAKGCSSADKQELLRVSGPLGVRSALLSLDSRA